MSDIKSYTLVFVKRTNKVLLGYKTRGLGAHFWNGFGGKLELNETVEAAAHRELHEECNLTAGNLNQIAVMRYLIEGMDREEVVHVFTTENVLGDIVESEEMSPIRWFERDNIPFDQMWADTPLWFDDMLADKCFSMTVTFTNDMKHITNSEKTYYIDQSSFLGSKLIREYIANSNR